MTRRHAARWVAASSGGFATGELAGQAHSECDPSTGATTAYGDDARVAAPRRPVVAHDPYFSSGRPPIG